MTEFLKNVNGPGVQGLHPADCVITVRTAEALDKYDLVMLDISRTDTAVLSVDSYQYPGNSGSVFYSVRLPDADPTNSAASDQNGGTLFASKKLWRAGIFGVAQDSAASNGTVKVMFYGITPAKVTQVNSAHVGGEMYCPSSAGGDTLVKAAGTSAKIIGIVVGPPPAANATSATVWFNGLTGWGIDAT